MRFNPRNMSSLDRQLKSLRRRARTAGFTMAEILVASTVMVIAVLIAGNGTIQLLRGNYKANADSELRNNVNRTLEFISNEVRRATIIADSQDKIVSTRIPTGARAILAFQIADPNNPSQPISEQIVYYVQNRENPWLGPRVLWRYGPSLDGEGNYVTPSDTNTWNLTPVMDMVVDESNNTDRLGCDPYTKQDLAGWQRLPADDSQVEGIYSCVKEGGDQVILAANVQLNLSTNESAAYALSTKVATRSTDSPFYLSNSIGGVPDPASPSPSASPDPVTSPSPSVSPDPVVSPSPAPPIFTTDPSAPNRIVLTEPATVETTILQGPPGICKTGCYVIPRDFNNASDRFSRDLTSGSTTTVQANAGNEFAIYVEGRSNTFGNNRNQTVSLYTAGQTIPTHLPNITLTPNQILVVITNLRKSPQETYTVLVNILPPRA